MIRAVLDTNILVSALLFRGATSRFVPLWQEKWFVPLVSKAVVEEYLRVLAYPKFRLSMEEVKALVERQLLPFTHPVEVTEVPLVIREDPSDDIFLACASAGEAQCIVSGDRHLLALRKYGKISILSAADFLSTVK